MSDGLNLYEFYRRLFQRNIINPFLSISYGVEKGEVSVLLFYCGLSAATSINIDLRFTNVTKWKKLKQSLTYV